MTVTTSLMGLLQAQGTDNARDYLKLYLAQSLTSIDAHDHSSTKGAPVKRLASGTFGSRPAAGNAGHVYVATDSNRVAWDNGAAWIEAVLQNTGQLVTLSNGLNVASGNVGIGIAPSATTLLAAAGTVSGSTTYGAFIEPTMGNATSSANALSILPTTVNAFTTPFLAAFRIQPVGWGTTQSITNFYQAFMDSSTAPAGVANAYGLYINGPTGASGINLAAQLVGGGVVIGSIGNAAANYPPSGAIALGTGGAAAQSGNVRLPNTATVAWRNSTNGADNSLTFDGNDRLNMVGAAVGNGNAANVTLQAAGHGTGGGPSNPGAIVTWRPEVYNNVLYWIPLSQ